MDEGEVFNLSYEYKRAADVSNDNFFQRKMSKFAIQPAVNDRR